MRRSWSGGGDLSDHALIGVRPVRELRAVAHRRPGDARGCRRSCPRCRPGTARRLRGRRARRARLALILAALLVALPPPPPRAMSGRSASTTAPGPAAVMSRIQVEPGMSLRDVWRAAGRARCAAPRRWSGTCGSMGCARASRPATTSCRAAASPAQILALLEEGKVVLEQLTVVEGAPSRTSSTPGQHPRVQHTQAGERSRHGARSATRGSAAEGEFFPDTYRFAGRHPDVDILGLAYDSMQTALAKAWSGAAAICRSTSPTRR